MKKTLRSFALVPLFTLSLAAAPAENTRPPNIVIILADDLGYGDVSCYGATKIATPNMDRLAKEGLRFTDAHATSATCTPSRYSLLTGQYAWRRPGTDILRGSDSLIIPLNRPTLPSLLQQAGYVTTAIGKWHLGLGLGDVNWNGDIRPGPCEIGFNSCFLVPATGDRVPCVYVEDHRVVGLDTNDPISVSYEQPVGHDPTGENHPELLKYPANPQHSGTIVNGISRIGYMSGGQSARWVDEDIADTLTRRATDFIEQNRAKPFFLYFSTHDIHVPRMPNNRFVGKSGLGRRGDATLEFDWSVGEVLATLDRLGLASNTLVIVTSDNGPVVNDGYFDGSLENLHGHTPGGPLRGGKYSAFEAGTRIPFIVRWPGHVKPGVNPALISQVDLAATLPTLAGHPPAAGTLPDSQNAVDALLGNDTRGRDDVVEQAFNGRLGVIRGGWKYIEPGPGELLNEKGIETGNASVPQLYDLGRDIGEKTNVAAQHPDRTSKLAALLATIRLEQPGPPLNLSAPPLARTTTSAVLLWDRPAGGGDITSYQIFQDGEPVGETIRLSFTARNLAPDKSHRFTVRSRGESGIPSANSDPVVVLTKPAGPVLNVRELGARGDGVTKDTAAIQKTIADCPPGGTVLIPPGVYVVDHLELKSDLTLELATGATLQFLGQGKGHYPKTTELLPGPDGVVPFTLGALITARRASNLTITGSGRICANGESWWPRHPEYRPRTLLFIQCTNVLLQDITIEDPPTWNTHMLYLDDAVFTGIKFLRVSPVLSHNADGLDLDSTRNALVVGCVFANQDDSIAIKSGAVSDRQPHRQRSSENITIRDCVFDGTLAPGARPLGFAIGSENCGGVRHVLLKDCVFRNVASLAYLKSNRARLGAVVEDIRVENCVFSNAAVVGQATNRAPISIDMFYYDPAGRPETAVPLTPMTPVFRDIHFKNIVIEDTIRRGIVLIGLPEQPIRNLTFTNVTVSARTGLLGQNLDGVVLQNVTVNAKEGPAFTWINALHRTISPVATAAAESSNKP
jgi:arylsulfatase A-like enzyme/polygalacturonase